MSKHVGKYMNDKINNIKKWINKNGYPLELKVAKTFKNAGFVIAQSILFKDSETEKYRETDIIAHITKGVKNVWFNITFVIECKKTTDKPWIVFKNNSERNHQINNPPFFGSINAQLLKHKILESNDFRSPIIFPNTNECGYNIVSAHSQNTDLAYSATQSVIKAIEYLVLKSNESNKKFCNIYVPLIIIEGELYNANLDINDEIEINQVNNSSVISTKSFEDQNSNLINVVTIENLENYAEKLMKHCAEFYEKYEKEIELISNHRPTNRNYSIYDYDFE